MQLVHPLSAPQEHTLSFLSKTFRFVFSLFVATALVSRVASQSPDFDFFERKIRPLLIERCYECHSGGAKRLEGGLRLDHGSFLEKGGDSGSAIDHARRQQSLLIQAIRYDGLEMPPSGKLSAEEIQLLTEWVLMGAPWPEEPIPETKKSNKPFSIEERKSEHWSWRPIQEPKVPLGDTTSVTRIDAFVADKLRFLSIRPSERADRATLVRRLYWDLLGVPPSNEVLVGWTDSKEVDWYERCLDSVLADPQFGVRFARHWLDLMRYAQSRGHEFDEDIPGAEHYRDYVVRAWNMDLPYDQFVREHIAGDLIESPRRHPTRDWNESILGTGFWHLGEWVHSPVDTRKDETDRFDNMVDVFSKSFLGLTVSCARCHDHKFDPISTEDYYALYGFLRSSHYRMYRFESDLSDRQILRELQQMRRSFRERVVHELGTGILDTIEFDKSVASDVVKEPIAIPLDSQNTQVIVDSRSLPDKLWRTNGAAFGESIEAAGFASMRLISSKQDVDDNSPKAPSLRWNSLPAISADPFWIPQRNLVSKVNSKNRNSQIDTAHKTFSTPSFLLEEDAISFLIRGGIRAVLIVDSHRLNAGPLHGETIFESKAESTDVLRWVSKHGLARYVGKRVHLEISPLDEHGLDLFQIASGRVNHRVEVAPLTKDSIQGYADNEVDPSDSDGLARYIASGRYLETQLRRFVESMNHESAGSLRFGSTLLEWKRVETSLKKRMQIESRVAMAMQDGSGQNDFLLVRGNSDRPSHEVKRRFLEALGGKQEILDLPFSSGRMEWAQRMLSDENPLLARVFVNRLWHHLMGRGIVPTTDDFGVQGRAPSHLELLDYLSLQLRGNNWLSKPLIREICSSHTYQQRSTAGSEPYSSDPNNEFLAFANVRKLEGESVRDAMLLITGQLDQQLEGETVRVHLNDFLTGRGRPDKSGSLHGDGRRSLYLEVRRNFLHPMLAAFDTPTPFSSMGRRNVSNVPAQALMLLNDPLVHWLAERWAEWELKQERSDRERIESMLLAARGRIPSDGELETAIRYIHRERMLQTVQTDEKPISVAKSAEQEIWKSFAHAILNSKELLFRF